MVSYALDDETGSAIYLAEDLERIVVHSLTFSLLEDFLHSWMTHNEDPVEKNTLEGCVDTGS